MQTSNFIAKFPHLFVDQLGRMPAFFARRRGSLGPRAVFLTLVTMSVIDKRSYGRALHELRLGLGRQLGWVRKEPSGSAFCQARKKLSPEECLEVFTTIRATMTRARALPRASFHGLRIHAMDGTKLNLPVSRELFAEFGCPGDRFEEGCPQAGLVVLWDVGANQPVGWTLGTYKMSERAAGVPLLHHLGPDDVLVCDRGYPGLEFFHEIRQRGTHFVIRMNTTTVAKSHELVDFLASSDLERKVSFTPVANDFRRFPGESPLTIRYVRDPENPERVLATSITDPAITPAEFWQLYGKRWNIETAIREGKQWHGLEDFHALFVNGIHQEIAAIMTFLHLTGELEAEMRQKVVERVTAGQEPPEAATTMPYTFNRLLMADMTIALIILAHTNPKGLADEWAYCLDSLWRQRGRIRPGRSYPRMSKSPKGLMKRAKLSNKKLKNED